MENGNRCDQNSIVILDLSFLADITYVKMHDCISSFCLGDKTTRDIWTISHSMDLVRRMFDDVFSNNMQWAVSGDSAIAFMREWLIINDIGDVDDFDNLSEDIVIYKLDSVACIIEDVVSTITEPNKWMIFHLTPKQDSLVVVKDVDYRIKWFNENCHKDEQRT